MENIYLWMISILYKKKNDGNEKPFCGVIYHIPANDGNKKPFCGVIEWASLPAIKIIKS